MAKVTGPLFSLDARGQVGGSIVYSYWKGRNYIRRRVIPHNPDSNEQKSVRAAVRIASQEYADLSGSNQTAWNEYAADFNNSGIAIWMKRAIDAWMTQHGTGEHPLSLSVDDPDDPTIAVFNWTKVT